MQKSENPIYALVAEYIFINDRNIEKRLARITLEQVAAFEAMTVERIAELCGVSVSTYLRFCRNIGYSSFTELKIRLVDALRKYTYVNTPFDLREDYTSENFFEKSKSIIDDDFSMLEGLMDKESCHRAAEALYGAKKIFMVDLLYSTVRFALHSDLAVTGKSVFMIHPDDNLAAMKAEGLDGESLVFFVYDGSVRTQDVCPSMEICKRLGCFVMALSCTEHFPGEKFCDVTLVTGKASSAVTSIMVHDLVLQYLSTIYREKYI